MSNMAGTSGFNNQSDCLVQWEKKNSGGVQVHCANEFESSIITLCREIFEFFGIENAYVEILANGALLWVIAARIEAAIKQKNNTKKDYLPQRVESFAQSYDVYRLGILYVPGNAPKMLLNPKIQEADCIIMDLEDAVAFSKKEEARILVRNALIACDFGKIEPMVRINQGAMGKLDLQCVVPHGARHIIVPKAESKTSITEVEYELERIKKEHNINYPIYIMPIIETAFGIEHVFEIANASKLIVSMAIGLEDYTADLGIQKSSDGLETLFIRSRFVNACHAVKIFPIDSIYSNVMDEKGFQKNVAASKALGFKSMACIHPSQIKMVKEGFAPNKTEIDEAKQIVSAAKKAEELGLGVVAYKNKMIDAPVVERNNNIIALAIRLGLLKKDWEI